MWQELLSAFCLMLILEGMMPFLYPQRWKQVVSKLASMDNSSMRLAGFLSMLVGLTVLYLVRQS